MGQRAESCERRVQIEKDRGDRLVAVEVELGKTRVAICEDAAKQSREMLQKQLQEMADPRPLWEEPGFLIPITAVITSGVLVGVWWLAVETVKATR